MTLADFYFICRISTPKLGWTYAVMMHRVTNGKGRWGE